MNKNDTLNLINTLSLAISQLSQQTELVVAPKVFAGVEFDVDKDRIDPYKYYGVKSSVIDCRGFIGREDYERGLVKAFSSSVITKGNCWNILDSDSYHELIEKIKHKTDSNGERSFRLYEFETRKDLFSWLTEGDDSI
jgi:hypothetical protein